MVAIENKRVTIVIEGFSGASGLSCFNQKKITNVPASVHDADRQSGESIKSVTAGIQMSEFITTFVCKIENVMNITVYTAGKKGLEADKENLHSEAMLLSHACGQSVEEVQLLIEGWKKAGKRIVHHYPGLGDFDPAGYEYFGDIPDGAVYIG